jgi:hypothetical protein
VKKTADFSPFARLREKGVGGMRAFNRGPSLAMDFGNEP